MRSLTIDDKWEDWKFGDTEAIMTFTALDDDQTPDFTGKTLTFKIADTTASTPESPHDYVASAAGHVEGNKVILKTEDVKTLTPGTYSAELWVLDNSTQKNAVYPSKGFAFFTIEENTMKVSDITNVPSKTLEAIWAEMVQRVGALKKGEQGEPGKTPKLIIGTVTKLGSDQQPSVSLIPTADDPNTYTVNFQIPQGEQGKQGDPGVPGTPGIQGLPGNNGLTPSIDSKTKHWMIGNTDTGIVAEGQPGKDADTSKFVAVDQFTTLRQSVSDNSAQLATLQGTAKQNSDDLSVLQDQVNTLAGSTDLTDVKKQLKDLQDSVKALQDATKPTTPDHDKPSGSDQPAKSDKPADSDKPDQSGTPAKSDQPASSADPAKKNDAPTPSASSSDSQAASTTPTSAGPASSSGTSSNTEAGSAPASASTAGTSATPTFNTGN